MAAGLCLITTRLCVILNASWAALDDFPRPGRMGNYITARTSMVLLYFHCMHAADPHLCTQLLSRGNMWLCTGIKLRVWFSENYLRQTVQHLLAQLQPFCRLGYFCLPTGTNVCVGGVGGGQLFYCG